MKDEGIVYELLSFSIDTWNEKAKEIMDTVLLLPNEFQGGAVYEKVIELNESMQAVSYALFVLFFLAGMIKNCCRIDELKRFESVIKIFLRFAVGKALISMSNEILTAIMKITTAIGKSISGGFDIKNFSYAEIPEEVAEKLEELSFIESIPLFAVALIFTCVIVVLSYRILLIVYGRFFKIYLYLAMSPVAFASFASDATSHMGKSFLRSFISVSMEEIVIVISLIIFSFFVSSVPDETLDGTAMKCIFSYLGRLMFNLLILNTLVSCSDKVVREMLN